MLERNERAHFTGTALQLEGKRVGLIGGNGTIGKRVCELAESVSNETVRVFEVGKAKTELYDVYQSLEELLSESDFVSVHCPLNDATRYAFDYEKLSLMKPASYLINTARGAICNEEDLIQILKASPCAMFRRPNERTSDEDSLLWNPGNVFGDKRPYLPRCRGGGEWKPGKN